MAVATNTLEIVNILVDGDVPRESAEMLAALIAEKFGQAVSEDQLSQQLALERERSDARFEAMLQRMDARLSEIDARFAQVDARFAELEVKIYRAVAAGTALILAAISVWAALG
jgi:hypothetical protein